jgi:hypothetical protein
MEKRGQSLGYWAEKVANHLCYACPIRLSPSSELQSNGRMPNLSDHRIKGLNKLINEMMRCLESSTRGITAHKNDAEIHFIKVTSLKNAVIYIVCGILQGALLNFSTFSSPTGLSSNTILSAKILKTIAPLLAYLRRDPTVQTRIYVLESINSALNNIASKWPVKGSTSTSSELSECITILYNLERNPSRLENLHTLSSDVHGSSLLPPCFVASTDSKTDTIDQHPSIQEILAKIRVLYETRTSLRSALHKNGREKLSTLDNGVIPEAAHSFNLNINGPAINNQGTSDKGYRRLASESAFTSTSSRQWSFSMPLNTVTANHPHNFNSNTKDAQISTVNSPISIPPITEKIHLISPRSTFMSSRPSQTNQKVEAVGADEEPKTIESAAFFLKTNENNQMDLSMSVLKGLENEELDVMHSFLKHLRDDGLNPVEPPNNPSNAIWSNASSMHALASSDTYLKSEKSSSGSSTESISEKVSMADKDQIQNHLQDIQELFRESRRYLDEAFESIPISSIPGSLESSGLNFSSGRSLSIQSVDTLSRILSDYHTEHLSRESLSDSSRAAAVKINSTSLPTAPRDLQEHSRQTPPEKSNEHGFRPLDTGFPDLVVDAIVRAYSRSTTAATTPPRRDTPSGYSNDALSSFSSSSLHSSKSTEESEPATPTGASPVHKPLSVYDLALFNPPKDASNLLSCIAESPISPAPQLSSVNSLSQCNINIQATHALEGKSLSHMPDDADSNNGLDSLHNLVADDECSNSVKVSQFDPSATSPGSDLTTTPPINENSTHNVDTKPDIYLVRKQLDTSEGTSHDVISEIAPNPPEAGTAQLSKFNVATIKPSTPPFTPSKAANPNYGISEEGITTEVGNVQNFSGSIHLDETSNAGMHSTNNVEVISSSLSDMIDDKSAIKVISGNITPQESHPGVIVDAADVIGSEVHVLNLTQHLDELSLDSEAERHSQNIEASLSKLWAPSLELSEDINKPALPASIADSFPPEAYMAESRSKSKNIDKAMSMDEFGHSELQLKGGIDLDAFLSGGVAVRQASADPKLQSPLLLPVEHGTNIDEQVKQADYIQELDRKATLPVASFSESVVEGDNQELQTSGSPQSFSWTSDGLDQPELKRDRQPSHCSLLEGFSEWERINQGKTFSAFA